MITVIIPYRDREEHLNLFIKEGWSNINHIIPKSRLVIVEQSNGLQFNRGLLLNIGFKEYINNSDWFITHDVDLLPSKKIIDKYYNKLDTEIVRVFNGHLTSLGGVCKLRKNVVKNINGFPNYIWGWGIEDRALYHRAIHKKIEMSKWFGDSVKNDFKFLNHKSNRFKFEDKKLKISNYINDIANDQNKMEEEIKSSGITSLKYSLIQKIDLIDNISILKVDFDQKDHTLKYIV